MKGYLRFVLLLIKKDISAEIKSKETVTTMVVFSVLTIVVFSFAFDPELDVVRAVVPGMIWIMILFSGILGFSRTFQKEQENATIAGLMLVPVDRSAIYLGKVLHNYLRLLLVELISVPLMILLFDYRVDGRILGFVPVVGLASFGFVAIGTLLAALSATTRWGDLLLPLIIFPLLTPIFISAVKLTGIYLGGRTDQLSPWLGILIVFDIVFFAMSMVLFEYLLEV